MENKGPWIAAGILTLGVIGGGVYYYNFYSRPAAAPETASSPANPSPEANKVIPAAPASLEQGDGLIRGSAQNLASSPQLATWFKTENLIRRITAAVDIVAEGNSPRDSLEFLSPGKKFAVKKKGAKIYLDPKSYARYDLVGDVFQSLNTQAVVSLYGQLKPLFDSACQEQGCWKQGFQSRLVKAIGEVLQTPAVEGPIRLKKKILSYAMIDGDLEGLSAAQKHLIRMGPKNAAKIQGKLREIALALGIPDDQLPKSREYTSKIK